MSAMELLRTESTFQRFI